MSHSFARIAIESKLNTWAKAQSPVVPAFLSNTTGDLPMGTFIRGFLLPASARTECLQGDETTYIGLYQVTISLHEDSKMNKAEEIVAQIQSLFPVDSDLGTPQFNGSITDAVDQGPTIYEDSRYNVPVTIPYRGVVTT